MLVEKVQDELELVELRSMISMAHNDGVEKIMNLKECLKSPWTSMDDL